MTLIAIVIILLVLVVALAFVRRTVRFFIKLALVGLLLLALLIAFGVWRWRARTTNTPVLERQPSAPARRHR
jgi:membrane protein implicated in regulation of membrane protease activity